MQSVQKHNSVQESNFAPESNSVNESNSVSGKETKRKDWLSSRKMFMTMTYFHKLVDKSILCGNSLLRWQWVSMGHLVFLLHDKFLNIWPHNKNAKLWGSITSWSWEYMASPFMYCVFPHINGRLQWKIFVGGTYWVFKASLIHFARTMIEYEGGDLDRSHAAWKGKSCTQGGHWASLRSRRWVKPE